MVDHSAKQYIVTRSHHHKMRFSTREATKIEAVIARTFTDDAALSCGALSAPRSNFRPGQRDDIVIDCTFVDVTAIK